MRFDISDLFVGFWKVLRVRYPTADGSEQVRPDVLARLAVVLVPIAAGALFLLPGAAVRSPDALLTGIAILAGGFLTSFTYLSTLRDRLTSRAQAVETPERDLVDEVATLLLVATFMSVAAAVSLVIGMNLPLGHSHPASEIGTITGLMAFIVAALCAHVAVLFLITIPRIYNAYVQINHVRAALSGSIRHD